MNLKFVFALVLVCNLCNQGNARSQPFRGGFPDQSDSLRYGVPGRSLDDPKSGISRHLVEDIKENEISGTVPLKGYLSAVEDLVPSVKQAIGTIRRQLYYPYQTENDKMNVETGRYDNQTHYPRNPEREFALRQNYFTWNYQDTETAVPSSSTERSQNPSGDGAGDPLGTGEFIQTGNRDIYWPPSDNGKVSSIPEGVLKENGNGNLNFHQNDKVESVNLNECRNMVCGQNGAAQGRGSWVPAIDNSDPQCGTGFLSTPLIININSDCSPEGKNGLFQSFMVKPNRHSTRKFSLPRSEVFKCPPYEVHDTPPYYLL